MLALRVQTCPLGFLGCASTSWGPVDPIPQHILHPWKGFCKTSCVVPTLCVLSIPLNYCQKTCADPGHSISLTMEEALRAAPGFSLVFSRVSSAGKVCDVAREGRGWRWRALWLNSHIGEVLSVLIDGAGKEPAVGALWGLS